MLLIRTALHCFVCGAHFYMGCPEVETKMAFAQDVGVDRNGNPSRTVIARCKRTGNSTYEVYGWPL